MDFSLTRAAFVVGLVFIVAISFQPLFLAGYTESAWLHVLTDFLALLLAYVAMALSWGGTLAAGGKMKRVIFWLTGGLSALVLVIFLGSLFQFYDIVNSELISVIQGLGLFMSAISLLIASFWLYSIIAPVNTRWQGGWLYVLSLVGTSFILAPSVSDARNVSEAVTFALWALSLTVIGLVAVASFRAFRQAGLGYRRFLIMFSVATTTFLGTLLVWPFPQNDLLTTPVNFIVGQVLMVLVAMLFLGTAFHLRQLEIYNTDRQKPQFWLH